MYFPGLFFAYFFAFALFFGLRHFRFPYPLFCFLLGAKPIHPDETADYELLPAGLKTFWGVTTAIDDDGRVSCAITDTVQAAVKPENSFSETRRKDIWVDWFGSKEEAEERVREAKMA